MCVEVIEFGVGEDIQVVEANILLRLIWLHRIQLFTHELGQVGPLAPIVGHLDGVVWNVLLSPCGRNCRTIEVYIVERLIVRNTMKSILPSCRCVSSLSFELR